VGVRKVFLNGEQGKAEGLLIRFFTADARRWTQMEDVIREEKR
jgi:hypothetical protein